MKAEFYKSIIDAIQNPIIILKGKETFHANNKALLIFGFSNTEKLKESHRLKDMVYELKELQRKNIYRHGK